MNQQKRATYANVPDFILSTILCTLHMNSKLTYALWKGALTGGDRDILTGGDRDILTRENGNVLTWGRFDRIPCVYQCLCNSRHNTTKMTRCVRTGQPRDFIGSRFFGARVSDQSRV